MLESVTGHSRVEIINQIIQLEFTVAMFGFLPGFVYLHGLPESLHVSRKSTPSTKMNANTLAMGGPYMGIYTYPSPGGWYDIGKIACSIFDKKQTPPMLIAKNNRFQFIAIDEATYRESKHQMRTINQYNEND